MSDLVVGVGMALIIEGVLYSLMPGFMQRLMSIAVVQTLSRIRTGGILIAFLGLGVVAAARSVI